MNHSKHLLTLKLDSETAVDQISKRMTEDGLQVLRSFDLKDARMSHTNCSCSYHGTDKCDSQMVVLLVFNNTGEQITLIAHGFNGETHFSIIPPMKQEANRFLESTILQALALEGFTVLKERQGVHTR